MKPLREKKNFQFGRLTAIPSSLNTEWAARGRKAGAHCRLPPRPQTAASKHRCSRETKSCLARQDSIAATYAVHNLLLR